MSSARMRLTRLLNQAPNYGAKPPPPKKFNILRGDKVQVVGQHVEAGKQGIVKEVLRDRSRVIVEGVHLVKKPIKGNTERGIKGRMIERERSIPYQNVNLVDPTTGAPTRIVWQFLDDGEKVRVSKRSGAVIPRPDRLAFRRRPFNHSTTESCTAEEDVWEQTYFPKDQK